MMQALIVTDVSTKEDQMRKSIQDLFEELLALVDGDKMLTETVFLSTQLTLNKVRGCKELKEFTGRIIHQYIHLYGQ
jgi:hypothetical protein